MNDYIIKGMAANNQIRFFAGYTKEIVETGRTIHNTSPVATAALGRLLTAGALMGSMCKNDTDVITLRIDCNGPIKGLTVTADSKANVKGIVSNPDVYLPPNAKGKLDVAKALDLGVLSVIKDIGMKEPYVGQTNLTTSEIAEDLTYYFATSEQIPTSVALGVLVDKDNSVKQAGGFIIQLMPFAEDETIDLLEKNINELKPITTLLDEGLEMKDIIALATKGMDMEITETIPTMYKCNCSRDRVKKALISIGKKEIADMVADGESITLDCQFCNSKYTFDIDELKEILNS